MQGCNFTYMAVLLVWSVHAVTVKNYYCATALVKYDKATTNKKRVKDIGRGYVLKTRQNVYKLQVSQKNKRGFKWTFEGLDNTSIIIIGYNEICLK